MYLQKVKKKSTLSSFDGQRCYINETESKPWEEIYILMFFYNINVMTLKDL